MPKLPKSQSEGRTRGQAPVRRRGVNRTIARTRSCRSRQGEESSCGVCLICAADASNAKWYTPISAEPHFVQFTKNAQSLPYQRVSEVGINIWYMYQLLIPSIYTKYLYQVYIPYTYTIMTCIFSDKIVYTAFYSKCHNIFANRRIFSA